MKKVVLLKCFVMMQYFESFGLSNFSLSILWNMELQWYFNCFLQVLKPLNQVLSSLVDQEAGPQIEHDNLSFDGSYSVDEFEVRIMEPEKSGGPWQTRATIPMQSSENALTVWVVYSIVSLVLVIQLVLYTLGFICLLVVVLCWTECAGAYLDFLSGVVLEYDNKRKWNSLGHWNCLYARGGCCCERACALVFYW